MKLRIMRSLRFNTPYALSAQMLTQYLIYFGLFSAQFFGTIEAGYAVPKIQIVLKPQLKEAYFRFNVETQTLHLNASLAGGYGESISGVKVRFSHPCFTTNVGISDFDGSVDSNLQLKPRPTLKKTCQTLIHNLSVYTENVVLKQLTIPIHKGDAQIFSWQRLPLISEHIGNKLDINISVSKSPINSQRIFTASFRQQLPAILFELHPLELIYKPSSVELVVTTNSELKPKFNEYNHKNRLLSFHYNLESLNTPYASNSSLSNRMEVDKIGYVSQRKKQIFTLLPMHTYRLSLTIVDGQHPPIKVTSEAIEVQPKFSLQVNDLEQSIVHDQLSLIGLVKGVGVKTINEELKTHLLMLIQTKQLKVRLSWRLRSLNTEIANATWTQFSSDLQSNGKWKQNFVLPIDQETQLKAHLIQRNRSTAKWISSGDLFTSEWLIPKNRWSYFYLFITIILTLFVYLLRYYLIRRKSSVVLSDDPHAEALELSWLSELDDGHLEADQESTILICNALTKTPIVGYINSINLEVFGAPKRWTPTFTSKLIQPTLKVDMKGSVIQIFTGHLVWVNAEGYEPLLIQIPTGMGCLVVPLWPSREALIRVWNDLLKSLNIDVYFGRGHIQSLRGQLHTLGGHELIDLLDDVEKSLYLEKLINTKHLFLLLSKMENLVQKLNYQHSTSFLYPPSDHQRRVALK